MPDTLPSHPFPYPPPPRTSSPPSLLPTRNSTHKDSDQAHTDSSSARRARSIRCSTAKNEYSPTRSDSSSPELASPPHAIAVPRTHPAPASIPTAPEIRPSSASG